ncbi:hypothetical protein GQ85_08060 [Rhodococcus rhodochrous]|nr:hypothetical protein GQ85_08060 [Rhodococcus rhodochrous]
MHGSLVQQLAQLPEVTGCIGEVGQPVQSGPVARIGQFAQGLPIDVPRCQGGCGSQKYTGMPVSAVNSW